MKFKPTMKSKSTIKKAKEYDFTKDGITEDIIERAKKLASDEPLFIEGKFCAFKLICREGKVQIYMLHSWDKFEEI